jgi:peptidoglycan hydrolase-like protein with peptidoglycan-binding domain
MIMQAGTEAKVVLLPTIRRPDTGEAVRMAQKVLIYTNYLAPKADGKFGPNTEAGVKKYQKAHGLVVDGIIGPNTWRKIVDDMPEEAPC